MHGGMDSKEDIYYDTSDSESLDDLCSDFNEMEMASNGADDNDDDDDERGYDHYEKYTLQPCEQNYIILSEADIRRHQDDDITAISSVLSLSRASSSTLIHHFKWSVSEVYNAWFADEEKVRKVVGLLDKPVAEIPENVKQLTCQICFETHPLDIMAAASCGHLFCATCWAGYISTSINDGPACLMLRCPDPSCDASVDGDMIDQLASDKDKEKYSRYFLRSYIETKRNAKWCPAPGCGYAVEFEVGSCGSYDVTCHCSYNFCWTCTEEIHRPVDCDTVAKWILKHGSEAENINWLLANSKPCPKCNRPIEKNHGCMHMTCTPPCGFEFCWLCLNPWSEHDDITGDYYSCNIYEIAKSEGTYDEAETRREMALNSLDRYVHYYERWASNQSSRQKASADLHQIQTRQLKELGHREGLSEMELEVITEAWLQIVECRRMLKWTYAYGYYIPEHDDAKRQFFEYLQGQAESGLERLHQCAEEELKQYLEADRPTPGFHDFHSKLVRLTRVTRNYFENLVQALENGLSDVVCIKACSSKSLEGLEGGKDTGRRCHRRISKCLGWCSHGWSH